MQHTSRLLMIEPVQFGYNPQTAVNNVFQKEPESHQNTALNEFSDFVELLTRNEVDVTVIKDTPDPHTPDSIFPNNWISLHSDNSIVLYPLFADNRRLERKQHILNSIHEKFVVTSIIDLTGHEKENRFLEGTGSMVLDHDNKIAYACLSARTNLDLLYEFCRLKSYQPISFYASDANEIPVYHTNVMMSIADTIAVICLESIKNPLERKTVSDILSFTNKEIIELSPAQMQAFAGNMLQVVNKSGKKLMVMSSQAYHSLTKEQIDIIQQQNRIVHSPLDYIESAGGGSARCMMAEIFLSPRI